MSTKGTLFLDDAGQVHLFHDVNDNAIHLSIEGQGELVLTPEMWRDLVAHCAANTLRNAAPIKLREGA